MSTHTSEPTSALHDELGLVEGRLLMHVSINPTELDTLVPGHHTECREFRKATLSAMVEPNQLLYGVLTENKRAVHPRPRLSEDVLKPVPTQVIAHTDRIRQGTHVTSDGRCAASIQDAALTDVPIQLLVLGHHRILGGAMAHAVTNSAGVEACLLVLKYKLRINFV